MGVERLATTPPPALTWLHLIGSDSKLCGSDAPTWMKAQLHACSTQSGPNVPVIEGATALLLTAKMGVVAINAHGNWTRSLHNAGLSYVRRFAAIPNLRQSRWLIPLDSPAVSSAAFALYTPTRFSARMKRWAARLATHLRLPLWYGDVVTIALPQPPPLERSLSALFPGRDIRIALSSGAPEGALNRKASALVMDTRGQLLAFVKLARSPIARIILAREADVLPKLSHLPVPRLLLNQEVDGTQVLVQSPLPGGPAPISWSASHREFLASLQTRETFFASDSAMVTGLPDRLKDWPKLVDVLDSMKPALRALRVSRTVVHGDFAPWNLRLHEGRISAFDWEYAELSGLPLIDQIHYALQVGMMLENWNVPRARKFLSELAESRALGLEPEHIRAIETIYVLDALARLLGEGYDEQHEMIVWHRGLLDLQPSAAAPAETGVAA